MRKSVGNKERKNRLLSLFLTFLKIGAFTFGGGYAMIALLESELVSKKKWIGKEEFLNVAAIAESTPGPMAVNSATYIGYQIAGFWGAALATTAVCIPSFVIIYLISLFFNQFLALEYVGYAFRGIQAGVIYLILSAAWRMLKEVERKALPMLLFIGTAAAMIFLTVFAVDFSSVYYILICGVIGLAAYGVRRAANRQKEGGAK